MSSAEYRQRHGSATSERTQQEALVKWAAAAEAERPALRLLFHSAGGRLRGAQRWWKENLRRAGHAYAVCHGWEEARRVLCRYLDGERAARPREAARTST